MNFVGHIHLARINIEGDSASSDDDTAPDDKNVGFLIGSALPDIAAMGRFRLIGHTADRSIAAGIDLHHRTDEAFHRHDWFRRNSRAVAQRLELVGLSRGAARACGHVGVELLLDGRLLDDQADLRGSVQFAMSQISQPTLKLTAAVQRDRQSDWDAHLDSVAGWPLPDDYRRPEAVASRLYRILSRRPRLRISDEQVGAVADTLAERQPLIETGVSQLIDDLNASLAA